MASGSNPGRGRETRQFDVTLISEVVEAISTRAVGRSFAIDQYGFVATVESLDLTASDYSIARAVASGVETGLSTLGDLNDAAMKGVEDPNPVRAGMRIFDALARGIDRAIEASPVNPLDGTISVLESALGRFHDVRLGHWRASLVEVAAGPATIAIEPGLAKLRILDVNVSATLDAEDIAEIVLSLGHDLEGEVVVQDGEVFLLRELGPLSVRVPLALVLDQSNVVVSAERVRIGSRNIRLPRRFARSHVVDLGGAAEWMAIESIEVEADSVRVEGRIADVEEGVTVQQARDLMTSLRSQGDVRLDRLR